jgi:hypothetical protein
MPDTSPSEDKNIKRMQSLAPGGMHASVDAIIA